MGENHPKPSSPFRNAEATNEGESADFAHFYLNFCYNVNVPWAIGKRGSDQ